MSEEKSGSIFNLEDLNPGVLFDMEGGGKVRLRVCAGDDFRNIRKQTLKKKVEYKNGQRHSYEEIDEDLENKLLWDFCIIDWENFFDGSGNPIPCTKENKVLLMGKSIKFSRFVLDSLNKLAEINSEQAEAESKN